MKLFFIILLAVISIIGKVMDAKSNNNGKTKPQHNGQPKPIASAEEILRRKQMEQELARQMQETEQEAKRQLAEQHKHYEEEDSDPILEETPEEEYDEEEETPHYEPIPAAQDVPPATYAPKPALTTIPSGDMKPTPLAQGLPTEGISAFDNNIQNNDISSSSTNEEDEPQFTIEEMRKAVIYQTILERPKF